MNVTLTPELEKFITEKIESGKYSSVEEVIREGLRLLREHEALKEVPVEDPSEKTNGRIVKPVTAEKEWCWIREHGEEYRGQWVALDGDQLVAHGTNAREVFAEARRAGVQVPALIEIPSEPELPWGGW